MVKSSALFQKEQSPVFLCDRTLGQITEQVKEVPYHFTIRYGETCFVKKKSRKQRAGARLYQATNYFLIEKINIASAVTIGDNTWQSHLHMNQGNIRFRQTLTRKLVSLAGADGESRNQGNILQHRVILVCLGQGNCTKASTHPLLGNTATRVGDQSIIIGMSQTSRGSGKVSRLRIS